MLADRPDLGEVIRTADGSSTLKHHEHGEGYHSSQGALFEARTLYIKASGLETRLDEQAAVSILDVGLGLGYNALATLEAWQTHGQAPGLVITSLEIEPRLVEALAGGGAPWHGGWSTAWRARGRQLQSVGPDHWRAVIAHPNGKVAAHWHVRTGDAPTRELHQLDGAPFDFIWQDPFSPAKNPRLWSTAWFAKARDAVKVGSILMTYSVARGVRDALSASGWQWERLAAEGQAKKHWLRAVAGSARPG